MESETNTTFNATVTFTVSVTDSNNIETEIKAQARDDQSLPRYVFFPTQRCEVYNLSITAFYDGAIFTNGNGCSVSSHELNNVMLPSLADIRGLESSLNYSVAKQPAGEGVVLNMKFMVSL